MKNYYIFGFISTWAILIMIFFTFFAYEISEFNAKTRLLLTSGKIEHRIFDTKGLPISRSPRLGEFISPFYVVYYGLYYSANMTNNKNLDNGIHWRNDPSHQFWNVPPDINNISKFEQYFYNSADWLTKNVDYRFGSAHFIYNFDWPYKGYPSGKLASPWWSGLTDGYAIILLLRAYDHFGEEKFLNLAKDLYKSVLSMTDKGGSLSFMQGKPWIEEYVDPRVKSEDMSYVFNGMVYATYGVEAYEEFFQIEHRYSEKLYRSIFELLPIFNKNGWSYYDLIGNANNVKYHKIHTALLENLIALKSELASEKSFVIASNWRKSASMPGYYYILRGPGGVALYHFVFLLLFIILFPIVIYFAVGHFSKSRRR